MSGTTFLLKKPTEMLRQDHDRVGDLFARYEMVERNDAARKRNLFLEIEEEITLHSRIEETLFYPAVRKAGGERVRKALEDHRSFKPLLEELMAMDTGDPGFDAKLRELGVNVERHSRIEEAELFPLAKTLSRKTLQELSAGISEFRDRRTRRYGSVELPFYPSPEIPGDVPPPSLPPADSTQDKSRHDENGGSE